MSGNGKDQIQAHCNKCGPDTWHAILKTKVESGHDYIEPEDPHSRVDWRITWDMLECGGCKSISLRRAHWFSEWEGENIDYFPPAVARQLPAWRQKLPEGIVSLLKETHAALSSDSRSLAMMGARAMIDVACAAKVGDQGSFKKILKAMMDKGFLSEASREVFEAAFDAGSAAAHRGHKPSADEVNQVIDIVEHLLQAVYVLPKLAADLKEKTPPRNRAKSEGSG